MNQTKELSVGKLLSLAFGALVLLAIIIAVPMAGCPIYRVWDKTQDGKAQLAEASFNRQIKVQEAHAAMEAAKSLAGAEVERARGVAQANEIIGQSLKNNESYLRYLWIQGISHETSREVIYVPTEAGLPILEAGRLGAGPAASVKR
jgi:hypothetical protein